MNTFWEKAANFLAASWACCGTGATRPLSTAWPRCRTFVATRSAYVAQKTLYGYVKTRMGMRLSGHVRGQGYHRFAQHRQDARLCRLPVRFDHLRRRHRAARATGRQRFAQALARHCYAAGLRDNAAEAPAQFSAQDCIDEFERRLAETDWRHGARQPENFTHSPRALVRWAPIADNLKKFDAEIIENSVKFAWRDIREQFRKRHRSARGLRRLVAAIGY